MFDRNTSDLGTKLQLLQSTGVHCVITNNRDLPLILFVGALFIDDEWALVSVVSGEIGWWLLPRVFSPVSVVPVDQILAKGLQTFVQQRQKKWRYYRTYQLWRKDTQSHES